MKNKLLPVLLLLSSSFLYADTAVVAAVKAAEVVEDSRIFKQLKKFIEINNVYGFKRLVNKEGVEAEQKTVLIALAKLYSRGEIVDFLEGLDKK